ncbi:MAG: hypothetical protein ACTSPB_03725 [Candidatus Thorarchaeota archaeon]
MTNWKVGMMAMVWLLFAFGLLQMYEMGQSIASEEWTMTAVNAIGGNLVVFSALSLYATEVKA